MADYGCLPSPTDKYRKPTSLIFGSPRFTGFASKGFIETESVRSPTSILDHKPFSAFRNPFFSHKPKYPKPVNRSHWETLDSKGVGLGIVDKLTDEISDPNLSKSRTRMVLFGSQLRIQIPPLLPSPKTLNSPVDFGIKTRNSQSRSANSGLENSISPKSPPYFGIKVRNSQSGSANSGLENSISPRSPADFGIKTSSSQFGSANFGLESSGSRKSPFGSENSERVFSGCLSASEMELSEDYTCVITYGPNPRTTHIFDNCIVESCCGVVGISAARNGNGFCGNRSMSYPCESFLSFCYNCKKNLGQGKDIYIYRGEKAFCSSECRDKEMILEEEGMENLEFDVVDDDDVYRVSSDTSLYFSSCFEEQ